jgi:hypothetical protein
MFLIFLTSSAVLRGANSDAQSLRATEAQSMKWLTELRCEVAMNHLFEFIVVKRNRVQRSYRLNTVQQAARDWRFELYRRTFIARGDRQTSHSAVKRWMRFQSCVLQEKISSQSFIQQ